MMDLSLRSTIRRATSKIAKTIQTSVLAGGSLPLSELMLNRLRLQTRSRLALVGALAFCFQAEDRGVFTR